MAGASTTLYSSEDAAGEISGSHSEWPAQDLNPLLGIDFAPREETVKAQRTPTTLFTSTEKSRASLEKDAVK